MLEFGSKDVKLILKDFGEVAYWFSIVFLVPLLIVLIYQESASNIFYFILPFLICLSVGYILKKWFKEFKAMDARP